MGDTDASNSYDIALATEGDVDSLVRFIHRLVDGHREYISHSELQEFIASDPDHLSDRAAEIWHENITRAISSPDAHVQIARIGDRLAGFCIATMTIDVGPPPFGTITDIGVDRTARAGGLGSTLLAAAVDWLTSQGAAAIYLESGVRNHEAHDFFERRGFAVVSKVFYRPIG